MAIQLVDAKTVIWEQIHLYIQSNTNTLKERWNEAPQPIAPVHAKYYEKIQVWILPILMDLFSSMDFRYKR